jgi:hypothetical protein
MLHERLRLTRQERAAAPTTRRRASPRDVESRSRKPDGDPPSLDRSQSRSGGRWRPVSSESYSRVPQRRSGNGATLTIVNDDSAVNRGPKPPNPRAALRTPYNAASAVRSLNPTLSLGWRRIPAEGPRALGCAFIDIESPVVISGAAVGRWSMRAQNREPGDEHRRCLRPKRLAGARLDDHEWGTADRRGRSQRRASELTLGASQRGGRCFSHRSSPALRGGNQSSTRSESRRRATGCGSILSEGRDGGHPV